MSTMFRQAALYRGSKKSSTFDWEVRYRALLLMRERRHSVRAFDVFLMHVRAEGARMLMAHYNSAPAGHSGTYVAYRPESLDDSMKDLQCCAAVLAGDVVWLISAAPKHARPRNFYPSVAPETDSDSSDGSWAPSIGM
jgi:hypothetical protein